MNRSTAAEAAEATYLYQNDMGVPAGQENDLLDFSEKHSAWYMYQSITENDVSGNTIPASQVGEGYKAEVEFSSDYYNIGSLLWTGFETYTVFGGPVLESTTINGTTPFAYNGVNKWVIGETGGDEQHEMLLREYIMYEFIRLYKSRDYTEQQAIEEYEKASEEERYLEVFGKTRAYAPYDDWSLPNNSQYRISNGFTQVESYKLFPSLYRYENNTPVEFSKENLNAVKKEIASGHALVANISDQIKITKDIKTPRLIQFNYSTAVLAA